MNLVSGDTPKEFRNCRPDAWKQVIIRPDFYNWVLLGVGRTCTRIRRARIMFCRWNLFFLLLVMTVIKLNGRERKDVLVEKLLLF